MGKSSPQRASKYLYERQEKSTMRSMTKETFHLAQQNEDIANDMKLRNAMSVLL